MNKETYPLLEITEKGTYNLYIDDMIIIPQTEESFKKIVENEKLTVKFTKQVIIMSDDPLYPRNKTKRNSIIGKV